MLFPMPALPTVYTEFDRHGLKYARAEDNVRTCPAGFYVRQMTEDEAGAAIASAWKWASKKLKIEAGKANGKAKVNAVPIKVCALSLQPSAIHNPHQHVCHACTSIQEVNDKYDELCEGLKLDADDKQHDNLEVACKRLNLWPTGDATDVIMALADFLATNGPMDEGSDDDEHDSAAKRVKVRVKVPTVFVCPRLCLYPIDTLPLLRPSLTQRGDDGRSADGTAAASHTNHDEDEDEGERDEDEGEGEDDEDEGEGEDDEDEGEGADDEDDNTFSGVHAQADAESLMLAASSSATPDAALLVGMAARDQRLKGAESCALAEGVGLHPYPQAHP